MTESTVDVSYSQLAVFVAGLQQPFNDWNDRHIVQGFAWRGGSVSFRTLNEAGEIYLEIGTKSQFEPASSPATRVIRVPFHVPPDVDIEVGAPVCESIVFRLPAGDYELTFEHGVRDDGRMWGRLHFRIVEGVVVPAVLRADDELAPSDSLLMEASPA